MKRNKFKNYLKWIIWATIVIGIFAISIWYSKQAQKKLLGESYQNLGQTHIDIGATHSDYNSNPPTSGPHYLQPANWGIYTSELPDEQLVHNLEHGGIWISYNQTVSTDTILKIENLAKEYPNKMIVTPRAKNDSKIVLASWTRLLKLNDYDKTTMVNFIQTNKNESPEPLAQ